MGSRIKQLHVELAPNASHYLLSLRAGHVNRARKHTHLTARHFLPNAWACTWPRGILCRTPLLQSLKGVQWAKNPENTKNCRNRHFVCRIGEQTVAKGALRHLEYPWLVHGDVDTNQFMSWVLLDLAADRGVDHADGDRLRLARCSPTALAWGEW